MGSEFREYVTGGDGVSKKWIMRLIDDVSIPHWIIEEEVNELPDTYKRVGFCDSQEDAELIITAPELEATATRRLEWLRRLNEARVEKGLYCLICGSGVHGYTRTGKFELIDNHADSCELAKELADAVGSQD